MNLRKKVLLAQAPLAAVLVLMGVLAIWTVTYISNHSKDILAYNFHTVLVMQEIKEALEGLDHASSLMMTDERAKGVEQYEQYLFKFEKDLKGYENGITKSEEADQAKVLRILWERYKANLETFTKQNTNAKRQKSYAELRPHYSELKNFILHIVGINQDDMQRKSEEVEDIAAFVTKIVVITSIMVFLLGSAGSGWITDRLLRPLSNLGSIVRQIGEGNLEARALVYGNDEVARLAREFNFMAARLQEYRQSSIGELLQAQLAMQAAIDSLPEPVLIIGADGQLQSANEAAAKILGIQKDVESDPLAFIEEPLKTEIAGLTEYVLSGKGNYVPKSISEAILITKEDKKYYLLPRAQPVYEVGSGIVAATIILQDVSRMKTFYDDKSEALAKITHELKVPLDSVHMAIYALLNMDSPLNTKQQDILFAARKDCERLQGLIKEMLNVSRIEVQAATASMEKVRLFDVIDDSLHSLAQIIKSTKVTVEVDVSPIIPDVMADKGRLKVVLDNIINNAIRHSAESATVKVRAWEQEGTVCCEVHNKGNVIPKEYQEKIFEKFFHVPGMNAEGAGLGLYISREIVTEHGGKIGIVSDEQNGTTCWFTIPVAVQEKEGNEVA